LFHNNLSCVLPSLDDTKFKKPNTTWPKSQYAGAGASLEVTSILATEISSDGVFDSVEDYSVEIK